MTPASPPPKPFRLLFVCSGNICRSPLAEAIFHSLIVEAGLAAGFVVDSAGTHAYHDGEQADPRTCQIGRKYGLRVDSIARPVVDKDFDRFDLVIAMDRGHRRELIARAGPGRASRVRMMREFDARADNPDVPDPYYGGEAGFETMYAILKPACQGLLDSLRHDAVS